VRAPPLVDFLGSGKHGVAIDPQEGLHLAVVLFNLIQTRARELDRGGLAGIELGQ
jgi:hypothetical protein